MYKIDYLIYRVHPFGLKENDNETAPEKLEMSEILQRSNAESYRRIFMREHKNYVLKHQADYDLDNSIPLSDLV